MLGLAFTSAASDYNTSKSCSLGAYQGLTGKSVFQVPRLTSVRILVSATTMGSGHLGSNNHTPRNVDPNLHYHFPKSNITGQIPNELF